MLKPVPHTKSQQPLIAHTKSQQPLIPLQKSLKTFSVQNIFYIHTFK